MPYRRLLTCPTIIATCCAGFASYWGLALGLTWFTSYLVDGLGYSQTVGGNLTILPWIFGMCVVLTGGWLSQRLKKAGVSSRLSRGVLAASSRSVLLGGWNAMQMARDRALAGGQTFIPGRSRLYRSRILHRDQQKVATRKPSLLSTLLAHLL